jgi:pimeloyl-ACP methyl ester carboxylesterase
MDHFLSGDVRIAYRVVGEGSPFVLVHGFASTHAVNWIEPGWVDYLVEEGFQVIMLDLRGHGESEKLFDPTQYDRSLMAQDIANLIRYLGHERADIMGYSMGGMLAVRLARLMPEICHRVIVAGVGDVMFAPPRSSDLVVQALLAENPRDSKDAIGRAFRVFADKNGQNRQALAACYATPRHQLSPSDLKTATVPVLVATGERDVIAGAPGPLAEALPHGEVAVIAKRDHMRTVGDPAYKEAVLAFLRRT